MNKIIMTSIMMLIMSSCASVDISQDLVSNEDKSKLSNIIAARSDDDKARDGARNPQETLEFFGITSDMTVVEVLPGGGWYTKILAPYLANSGALYGVNYSNETWPLFGFFSEEQIAGTIARTEGFAAQAEKFAGQPIKANGMSYGRLDREVLGTADAVLFIRALHNLHRFEEDAGTLTQAINETSQLLKSGGIVGVVQHIAPESNSDESTTGNNGYLKKSRVLQIFDKAGYDLVDESKVNQNLNDRPSESDIVWRLPPTLNIGDLEGEVKEAALSAVKAIGESNRMTLKFKKR